MPTRPSDSYWENETGPTFYPGLNLRGSVLSDYAEALVAEAIFGTVSASWQFALADKGKTIKASVGSGTISGTIPPNASVAFPIGSIVQVVRWGAGAVTIVPGSGVTVRSSGGGTLGGTLRVQYSGAVAVKADTNEWWLQGDLA